MRLEALEIEGFGPFRKPQRVDFSAFRDDGLFIIAGRTGAGKSSILDAVCFALFGSIPRYAAGEKRLRSDHSEPDEPSAVALEFTAGDHRYRVERSPEYLRPAKRGGGMTKQAAEVRLFRSERGQWQGLGARAKDVDGELLPQILQLTKDQFLQVILLAQNRFARFLLAKHDERKDVLRTLFGTRRFDEYAQELEVRRKAAGGQLASRQAEVDRHLANADDVIAQLSELEGPSTDAADEEEVPTPSDEAPTNEARLGRVRDALSSAQQQEAAAKEAVARAEVHFSAANAALQAQSQHFHAQQRRNEARIVLDRLNEESASLESLRQELQHADAAEVVRSALSAQHRASVRVERAERAYQDKQHQYMCVVDVAPDAPEAQHDAEAFERYIAQLSKELGALGQAEEIERNIPSLEARCNTARQNLEAAQERLRAGELREHQFPIELEHLNAERDELAGPASRVEDAATKVDRAAAALAAAERAVAGEEALRVNEDAYVRASDAAAAASRRVAELLRARLHGFAGALASELAEGEPCAVCGSLSHPSPAVSSDRPITEEEITAAEARRDEAATAEQHAREQATKARDAHAAAVAEAEGKTVDEWTTLRAAAVQEHMQARSARQRRAELDTQRAALLDEQRKLQDTLSQAREAVRTADTSLTSDTQKHEAALTAVVSARGDYGSVQEKVASVTTRLGIVQEYRAALDELSNARREHEVATQDVASLLEKSPFALAEDAHAALRDTATRDDLRQHVHRADEERRSAAERIREADEGGVPAEPINLAPFEADVVEKQANWGSAQARVAEIEQRVQALAAAVVGASKAHADLGEDAASYQTLERLASSLNGREPNQFRMTLETFVLAAELEDIVNAANVRLQDMSNARYRLVHSDERASYGAASGLGIEVFDANTGRTRPASSLSGGETFLASLALALGLAEVVTSRAGGVRLDTLFIDEGFGSLDAETLDVAMRTLDALRAGGRTVGVISHVEAMQEQIPAKLEVKVLPDGSSGILQSAADESLSNAS